MLSRFSWELSNFFTGVFTGDWQMAWEGIKKIFIGAFQALTNFFNLTFIGGIKKFLLSFVKDGIVSIIKFATNFKSNIDEAFGFIGKKFLGLVKTLKDNFIALGKEMWAKAKEIGTNVSGAFNKIGDTGKTIWNAIKGAFSGAVSWFVTHVVDPIIKSFQEY